MPIYKTKRGYKIVRVKGYSPTYPLAVKRLRAVKASEARRASYGRSKYA